jgi:hypothetical protein
LEQICASIISEGGQPRPGVARSVSRGTTPLAVTSANLIPLLSIRTRAGFEFTQINVLSIEAITVTTNAYFRWVLILNPVINGVDAAVWVPVNSSSVEYDISRTQNNNILSGIVIAEGYVTNAVRQISVKPESYLTIGKRLLAATPKDQFVLAVQNVVGNNVSYYGALQYEEST